MLTAYGVPLQRYANFSDADFTAIETDASACVTARQPPSSAYRRVSDR